jgi:hypothetical protein
MKLFQKIIILGLSSVSIKAMEPIEDVLARICLKRNHSELKKQTETVKNTLHENFSKTGEESLIRSSLSKDRQIIRSILK